MKLPAAPQAGSSLCSDKLQGVLAKANKPTNTMNIDKFVKGSFNVWIPAFAGMTDSVSYLY